MARVKMYDLLIQAGTHGISLERMGRELGRERNTIHRILVEFDQLPEIDIEKHKVGDELRYRLKPGTGPRPRP